MERRVLTIVERARGPADLPGLLRERGLSVLVAHDATHGLRRARNERPELVVAALPRGTALAFCQRLAGLEPRPRLLLLVPGATAEDLRANLAAGADECVARAKVPLPELVARIAGLLEARPDDAPPRPDEPAEDGGLIERPGLRIDPARHQALVDGRPVALTAAEFRLLHLLASRAGATVSRAELFAAACPARRARADGRLVDVHVAALRRKLGPLRDRLETVVREGYRWRLTAEVRRLRSARSGSG